WRGTWLVLDPRTKVVKPKKGRGSYNRKQKRGIERIRDGDAQDLLLFRLRGTI
ncbi:MAG: alternative ribosome rescue factor ArfA, partial [Sulfobacillus sp.]